MRYKKPVKIGTNKIKNMIKESINQVYNEMVMEHKMDNSIKRSLRRALMESEEGFASTFEKGRDDFYNRKPHGMFGMELKNPEGEWEYGNIEFNPNTMEMSCMGATIQVEDDWTLDEAIEVLYEELMNQGYYSE